MGMRKESHGTRLYMVTVSPASCSLAGMISIHDRVRWLSSVCEVITEPSAVAPLPAVMEVHPSGYPPSQSGSWASNPPEAKHSNNQRTGRIAEKY